MTLDDLIRFSGGLALNAEIDYVLVERQIDLAGTIQMSATELDAETLSTSTPVVLQPEDKIIIFDSNLPRAGFLQASLDRLRAQANIDEPTQIVSIIGNVRFPGLYPLQANLTVDELIRIAGGMTESAESRIAEVTRYDAEPAIGREIDHVALNLESPGADGRGFALQSYDQLIIRQMPNWTEVETVSIQGEVSSPGTYVITQDETVAELIQRAGGLTQYADPDAAVFLRESLRETEAQLIREFRNQVENDIITLRLQQPGSASNVQNGGEPEAIQLLNRLETLEPVGRLVFDLPELIEGQDSLILRDNDQLLIPRLQQEITVSGEVYRPTSHLYQEGNDYRDYIAQSGGFTDDADSRNIYVIHKNGYIEQLNSGYWFFQNRPSVEPGDTLVVPFDAYKPYAFFVWSEITQIVASLSTTLLLIDRIVSD